MPIGNPAEFRGTSPSTYGGSHSGEATPRVVQTLQARLGKLVNTNSVEPHQTVVHNHADGGYTVDTIPPQALDHGIVEPKAMQEATDG